MAKVALDGANITESTSPSNHITYTYDYYDPCKYVGENGCIGGWSTTTGRTSAKIVGTVTGAVSNVVVQGKRPIVVGDRTRETDIVPSPLPDNGYSPTGNHTNVTTGSVTGGNNKNVFINGKSVAVGGSTVRTHAGNNTSVGTSGLSSTVNIGG